MRCCWTTIVFVVRSKRVPDGDGLARTDGDEGSLVRLAIPNSSALSADGTAETSPRPHGSMAELSLVYILQDLVSHGMEEGEPLALPCCWYQLRSRGHREPRRSAVSNRQATSTGREFIFYALELPMPSPQEILIARDRFSDPGPGSERGRELRSIPQDIAVVPGTPPDRSSTSTSCLRDNFQRKHRGAVRGRAVPLVLQRRQSGGGKHDLQDAGVLGES